MSALTGASVASEHNLKTRTALETSPSDSFFSTEALMLRASDLLFAPCRVGGAGEGMVDAEVESDMKDSTWRLMIVVRDTFSDGVVTHWGAARVLAGKENSLRQAEILPLSFEQASSSSASAKATSMRAHLGMCLMVFVFCDYKIKHCKHCQSS